MEEDILNDTVALDDLKRAENQYKNELNCGNDVKRETQFHYAICLVRSRYSADIRKGIILLQELFKTEDVTNDSSKRDYLYYLALGNARIKEYTTALQYTRAFLQIEPSNHQVATLEALVKKKLEAGPDESDVEFLSSPSTFNVLENSTIHIPCFLKWMENTTTEWFRNGRKIADSEGSFYATPSNMEAERNYSLRISNIKRIDSGEYSCEVFVLGLRKPLKQSHLVNVFFPPTVYPDPSTGSMEVELPQGFILTCDVIGNPQPRVKWYFQNRLLPMQRDHSVILNVTKSTKGHSGEYQCVADNSIGKPVTATFTIRILYHPEVVAEKTWIHSAIGERTELACSISANPIAKVDWFHEGIPINMSSTISTRVFGEKHILTIKNMRYSDFGNYTCQGTNFLGRSYQDIHVSGLANTAVFKRDPQIRTETSYTLIWEVDSYSPVIQYSLRFRKQQEGDVEGRWLHLIIPATNVFMSPIQSEMYTLNGLERATVYEASVSAKNVFGWNEYSKIFTFTTLGTESSGNESQNANVTKSIISNISSTITESENFTTDVNSQENALWSTDNASISKLEISVIMSIVISALL